MDATRAIRETGAAQTLPLDAAGPSAAEICSAGMTDRCSSCWLCVNLMSRDPTFFHRLAGLPHGAVTKIA
jgi:hypothetical protein